MKIYSMKYQERDEDFANLAIGKWINPEPWHKWFGEGGPEDTTQISLLGDILTLPIYQVDFQMSLNGKDWETFDSDNNGTGAYVATLSGSSEGDRWSGYFDHSLLQNESALVYFRARVFIEGQEEILVSGQRYFDATPPSSVQTNLRDGMVVEDNQFMLQIEPILADIESIGVHIETKVDTFSKGIPQLEQRKEYRDENGNYHCAPTAASACLSYFGEQGDTQITAGLSGDALTDSLAEYMNTNDHVLGTYVSDIRSGLKKWIRNHGNAYTMRKFEDFDFGFLRGELERSQNVLTDIYWPGGGGHAMTMNSIVNTPLENGRYLTDYMDPWTTGGVYNWGEVDSAQQYLYNFNGAGAEGDLGDVTVVCPKETQPIPDGYDIYDLPEINEIPIELPDEGWYFIKLIMMDSQGNKHTKIYSMKYQERDEDFANLAIGKWINPEPWHKWFGEGGPEDSTKISLLGDILSLPIYQVDFQMSLNGQDWETFDSDNDGAGAYQATSLGSPEGDRWSGYFDHSLLQNESALVYFRARVFAEGYEEVILVTGQRYFDATPPNSIQTNLEDGMSVRGEQFLLQIEPILADIESIGIHIETKVDTFSKGIPQLEQRKEYRDEGGDYHCAPTAASACLSYFGEQGDTQITAGLSGDALTDSLAEYMNTNQSGYGTYVTDIRSGLKKWIRNHGNNYTMRRFHDFDFGFLRGELERSQNVLVGIYWPGGGGHAITMNSIVNTPLENGRYSVDFMDPWTTGGVYNWGEVDSSQEYMYSFNGAGDEGDLGDVTVVCPKETVPIPDGYEIYMPEEINEIPLVLPEEGWYFIKLIIMDGQGNKYTKISAINRDDNYDLDGDGIIDLNDLKLSIQYWKTGNLAGDLNNDFIMDIRDIQIMIVQLGLAE
jgi:hypothetical protein